MVDTSTGRDRATEIRNALT
ncbi:hypothetical protein, partial [Frankia sp. AvcI1]